MRCYFLPLITLLYIPTALAGWEVHWVEKFDGTQVDTNLWTHQIQADYTGTEECYTDNETPELGNAIVSNGTLKIIARRGDINCPGLNGKPKTWTSARINTKDKAEFLYGRVEARLRFPQLNSGLWPAFWALEGRINEPPIANDGDNIPWPNIGAGEIDIWEWMASMPNTFFTAFHNIDGWDPVNPKCGVSQKNNLPNGATDILNWHTYAMEWDETTVKFYMDNQLLNTNDLSQCPQYKEPMFILLNIQIGGPGGPIDPALKNATMEVDYVAHCLKTNSNNATNCNESTPLQLDNDADGVRDQDDLCLDTPVKTKVNLFGCGFGEKERNIAPTVSLQIFDSSGAIDPTQTKLLTNQGFTIKAKVKDINAKDTHTYKWKYNSLAGITENGDTISYAANASKEGSFDISVEVFDSGEQPLRAEASTQIRLTTPTTNSGKESKTSGGGRLGIDLILGLLLLIFFKCIRQKTFFKAIFNCKNNPHHSFLLLGFARGCA